MININDKNSLGYFQPFTIFDPYKDLDIAYNKEWVCKGKHQYRQTTNEINGTKHSEWVCQCGKSLTSKTK